VSSAGRPGDAYYGILADNICMSRVKL
jgi:hypothetical protein